MSDPIVTISGQRVYPRGQAPDLGSSSDWPDSRDGTGRPLALTEMSPNGWASGGNEETLEAGLPFMGALIAIVVLVLVTLLLLRRSR